MTRFTDFSDSGTYTGDLVQGRRHGTGKMVYDSGNVYEGEFQMDKYEGKGLYRWTDGDEQESTWLQSKRHGPSLFRASNGEVEYSNYAHDEAKGVGVTWSADRKTAYKLVDGKKGDEISLGMAEKIAESFGWGVPEVSVSVGHRQILKSGLMARMFSSRYVDGDGRLRFKDHGSWGTYVGEIDSGGNRVGHAKITYDDGSVYEGMFVDDKYEGEGVYTWDDGEQYKGEWANGERNGKAAFTAAGGIVEYCMFKDGKAVGEGVSWSADRKTAHRLKNGEKQLEMLSEEAEKFALETFNWPVPEVVEVVAPVANRSVGLFQRLFNYGPRYDANGKLMHKDNGDWGSWSGEVDADNKRKGKGIMTYESGTTYEGIFVNDLYEDDSGEGKYTWDDGEYYLGQWKNGERHGKGTFFASDGSVEYSNYKAGAAVGQGLKWSADRQTAYRLVDGSEKNEISLGVAEKEAKEKFDLPVPEKSALPSPPPKASKASQPGLFQRLFRGAPPLDEDGNPMFKDNGDWGSYVGERDANGHRQGKGKMTYKSGAVYEGDFVDNKYEGEGRYTWDDGDEYFGDWKDGERNGKGTFTHSDGTVEISVFDYGVATGEGVSWSPDRETAHKLVNGDKKVEMLPEEAKDFALEKFNVPVPEVSAVTPKQTPKASNGKKDRPSIFSRLWNKYDADGNLMYKDNGDWGSWKGDLDSDGKRIGNGTMAYEGGATYEGGFVDDKYEGYGIYAWDDGDVYEGEWKNGERNGKGIFRGADGTVEYSMYDNGACVGEGVSWDPSRKTAHRLKDGDKKLELLVEEAEKFCKEKFDLPIPEYYEPKKKAASVELFGFFKSNKQVGPAEEPKPQVSVSPFQAVDKWLKTELPNLNPDDLKTYSKQLFDDGFDSPEMLDHLEVGDLGFMKKAHQRVLVEKLKAKKDTE